MSKKKLIKNRTPVDEDDLCQIIYHMLWNKNVFYPSSSLPILVPDTVIFRSGIPIAWYFSDSEAIVRKKLEANLTIEAISKTFLRKKSKYGIIAYFMYLEEGQGHNAEDSDEDSQKTIIEYFDEEAFQKLMTNPVKLKKGILQRFIDPPGDRNSVIQCIWTKRIAMFNRRTNYRLLKDNNANIYEKCVTFEGPSQMCESSTAIKGNALAVKVKEALDFIVNHISNATFEKFKVSKLVCYLKVDDQSRIWYMYSGFFRASKRPLDPSLKGSKSHRESTEPLQLNENLSIPSNIHISKKIGSITKKTQEKLETCPRCGNIYSSSNFVEVNYQTIMEAAEKTGDQKSKVDERGHTPNVGLLVAPKVLINKKFLLIEKFVDQEENEPKTGFVRSKLSDIPYIIRKVHQNMRPHEYDKIKNEDYFKIKKTIICYNCYFFVSKSNEMGGNDLNPAIFAEKPRNYRPMGQTLTVNTKLKTIIESKNRNNSVPTSRRFPNRAASTDRIRPEEKSLSLKRDRSQVAGQSSYYDKPFVDAEFRVRGKDRYDKTSLTSQVLEQRGSELPTIEWGSQVNIFDANESGKIIKLEHLANKQSFQRKSMLAITPLSRSSSVYQRSNNYVDALCAIIQSTPQEGIDFHRVGFAQETDDAYRSDLNLLYSQENGNSITSHEKFTKLVNASNLNNLKTSGLTASNSEKPSKNTGSSSDRPPRNSARESSYQSYLAKQIDETTKVPKESSKGQSNIIVTSSASRESRERHTSENNEKVKDNLFEKSTKNMIKAYMGKVPSNQVPSTKKAFNVLKFIYGENESVKLKNKKVDNEQLNYQFAQEELRAANTVFEENRIINTQEGEIIKVEMYPIIETAAEENKSMMQRQTPENRESSDDNFTRRSASSSKLSVEQNLLTRNQIIETPEVLQSGQLPISQKLNNSQERSERKYFQEDESKQRRASQKLEELVNQQLRSSTHKRRILSPHLQSEELSNGLQTGSSAVEKGPEVDFRSKDSNLEKIPNEQFNELTAKPFYSKRENSKKFSSANSLSNRSNSKLAGSLANGLENNQEEYNREIKSRPSFENSKSYRQNEPKEALDIDLISKDERNLDITPVGYRLPSGISEIKGKENSRANQFSLSSKESSGLVESPEPQVEPETKGETIARQSQVQNTV